ncbi:MAG: DUF4391 domain-containing protein [Bacteroides sp.]|nr:DUF4391 domain-containing protein [Ruminococcus flavefaciens]MCM1554754.1 DUF4391 domain-containing protein [Bacteroides sp.]
MENLLKFPQGCFVDKLIPKAKFVKASATPTAVRDLLAGEFEQIRLLYVLRADTLNVAPGEEVNEIDVFYFRCKTDSYSIKPFCALDKLIPRHCLYVIQYGEYTDVLMQHKQRVEHSNAVGWKIIASELRKQVNLADLTLTIQGINMDAVYSNLLAQISQKPITSIDDYTEQKAEEERVEKLRHQIVVLEKQMATTKQPRRKRELFVELQKLKDSRWILN